MAAAKVSSVFRSGLFAGKAAIVTGGGTGIGCAIAQELLHLGKNYHHAICHRFNAMFVSIHLSDNKLFALLVQGSSPVPAVDFEHINWLFFFAEN